MPAYKWPEWRALEKTRKEWVSQIVTDSEQGKIRSPEKNNFYGLN